VDLCCRSTSPYHLVIFLDNTHIYNCNGEGHIAKQCTKKKKVKNSKWFKDKMLLAQAQELQATTNFKADHFDAYNLDCDGKTIANAIFMENLSSVGSLNDDMVEPHYDSDILSIVPYYDTYHDSDMIIYNIQELGYIENIVSNNESYDELTSKNNVISYTNYMLTIGDDADNYVPPPIQKNDMILSQKFVSSLVVTFIAVHFRFRWCFNVCHRFVDETVGNVLSAVLFEGGRISSAQPPYEFT
nr:hypothetical protein [Tanacetum cinerariifolium]